MSKAHFVEEKKIKPALFLFSIDQQPRSPTMLTTSQPLSGTIIMPLGILWV
jgi:hypothetical protein